MKILIAGLGLIGGSLCKALKKYTTHKVYAVNRSRNKLDMALADNSIDAVGDIENDDYDIIFLCMYKKALEDYIIKYSNIWKKGTIIADVCGLKGDMTEKMTNLAASSGLCYIGTHPMAGKEVNGYIHSDADLFKNCNFILTPTEKTDKSALKTIADLALEIGCGRIVYAAPDEHDEMIAYTSHMPHIVAGCLADNPLIKKAGYFSGGSFRDVTRVATMDEYMWAELFLDNSNALLKEIDNFKSRLDEFETHIKNNDIESLEKLIKRCREKKESQTKNNE